MHVAVSSENVAHFRRILAEYEAEHPGVITSHGVGFLGHNYLVHTTEDISKVFREAGILCSVKGSESSGV